MATNEKIKLDITSAFDPGGFAKANNAVRDLGGEMKKGGKVAGNLMDAFGAVPGPVGEVVNGVRKLGLAFSAGGWIALAAAGVAFLVVKFFEAKEAAAKLAEETRKMWREDQIKNMEKGLEALKNRHSLIADEIEREAKNVEKLAKSYEELAKSKIAKTNAASDAQVASIELETAKKLLEEKDPNRRQRIEIDGALKIFELKKQTSKMEMDDNIKIAQANVENAKKAHTANSVKFGSLRTEIEELQLKKNQATTAMNKASIPMPSQKDFQRTIWNNDGIMGAGGTRTYVDDKETYKAAMEKWTKDNEENLKPFVEGIQILTNEISKKEIALKDESTALKMNSDAQIKAQNELDTVTSKNIEISKKTEKTGLELASKSDEFNKAQDSQLESMWQLYTVQQEVLKCEEKIQSLKEKEKDREDSRNQLIQNNAQAKGVGAVQWNQDINDQADAKKALDKSNQKEAKWVENAEKRRDAGTKLSPKDIARVANFNKRDNMQIDRPEEQKKIDNIKDRINKGFFVSKKDRALIAPFDAEKGRRADLLNNNLTPQQQMLAKMNEQVTELKALNTNLTNSLKVN